MNTCGDCPRRPAEAALLVGARKGVRQVLSGGRHLELGKVGALTCSDGNGLTRLSLWRVGSKSPRDMFSRPREVSEGSTRRSRRKPTKLRCFKPPRAKEHERGSRSARSQRRAVKRGAAGGRMTARWSGVVRGSAAPRASALRRRSRCRTSAGFPRRSAGSPQR